MTRLTAAQRAIVDAAGTAPRMLDLVAEVAPAFPHRSWQEVVAEVWELIHDGILDYGTDARIRVVKEVAA